MSGGQIFMSNLSEKRRKFQPTRKSGPSLATTTAVVAVLLVLGAGAIWALRSGSPRPDAAPSASASGSAAPAPAKTTTLQMTSISAKVENGKISIPLDTVKEKGLVRFTYKGAKGETPLLAYVAPSGKVTTAVSVCEPCSSTRFFIQDSNIVCSACYTRWDLENLKGISGGCTRYPPDRLQNTISGGSILIDESIVAKWQPRV
jgi:hypothetical protein